MDLKYLVTLAFLLCMLSCKNDQFAKQHNESLPSSITNLDVDHLVVWVKNADVLKQKLIDSGFKSVPDSLSQVHKGQGTAGKFFNFLNGYLELIFIHDRTEFERNNKMNKNLDFAERDNFEDNGASPFGVALKMKDYNVQKIPFEAIQYHQDWMEENRSIYAAMSSKTHLEEPSIFVVYPEIASDVFQTMADLKNIPEEYAVWREFFKHPNGAKKITDIHITSTGQDFNSQAMQALEKIEGLTITSGEEHLMEITFDENIQGKAFDLRPHLPLKIYI